MWTFVHILGRVGVPYVLLAGAIGSEIAATTLLKQSVGFSRLWPSVGTVAGYLVSFALLSLALKTVPVSVAYAIWSGVGTAVIAAIGMVVLGEPVSLLKIGGIALIIAGVVALSLGGAR
jgi:small multidrug resistance pump